MPRRFLTASVAVLLAGCGSDSTTPNTPASNLTGTVATGAPVSGATITARCSNGSSYTTTSRPTGSYGLVVPAAGFPCAVRASGTGLPAGTSALHSFAPAPGTTNVTPLTDLALALQVNASTGQTLVSWFASPTNWTTISTAVGGALDDLRDALAAAGYTLPAAWTAGSTYPLSSTFTPDPATSAMDRLLEDLAAAIADPASTYADYDALLSAFRTTPNLPAAADPGLSGDGAALGGGDGVTGTLSGTTRTYQGNAQWAVLPSGGTLSAFLETGGGGFNALTRWDISGVPASTGTYACKSDGNQVLPRIQLTVDGVPYSTAPAGGSCTIKVTEVAGNYATGQFNATLVNSAGQIVGTVSDGFFRKAVATGGGGGLSAGEQGAAFNVDGTDYRYTAAYDLSFETFKGMAAQPAQSASPGYPIGIQIHTLPATPGTYACDAPADGSNLYRKINIWFYWNGKYYTAGNRQWHEAGPAGSSCSITLTQAGSTQEGSFSGTFKASDGSSVTVSNGAFRFIGPVTPPSGLPSWMPAMAGVWGNKISIPNISLDPGFTFGTPVNLIIESNGNVTAAGYAFNLGAYTSTSTSNNRETSYQLTLANGNLLKIYHNGNTPMAFSISIGGKEMEAVLRPAPAAVVDFLSDLVSGGTRSLKNINSLWHPTNCSETHSMTVGGTPTTDNPYTYYQSPGAYEEFKDRGSRLVEQSNGDRDLYNYYGRLRITAAGHVYWYAYNGNGNEYGEYWTNDPAACP